MENDFKSKKDSLNVEKNKANINNNIKTNTKTKTQSKSKLKSGCCSFILKIDFKSYVYGYRRYSTYFSNLNLKKVKIYGMGGFKEYKKEHLLFNSLILKNGWHIVLEVVIILV